VRMTACLEQYLALTSPYHVACVVCAETNPGLVSWKSPSVLLDTEVEPLFNQQRHNRTGPVPAPGGSRSSSIVMTLPGQIRRIVRPGDAPPLSWSLLATSGSGRTRCRQPYLIPRNIRSSSLEGDRGASPIRGRILHLDVRPEAQTGD
jgi:hypothetical protein